MLLKQFLLLVVCLGAIHGAEVIQEQSDVNNDLISAILKYLGEHNSYYFYNRGSVVQSFVKDDKVEVTSDVEITCNFPCTGGTLRCESVLRRSPDDTSWIVAGTICAPQEPYFEVDKYVPNEEQKQGHLPEAAQRNAVVEEKTPFINIPNEELPRETNVNKKTENTNKAPIHCLGCPLEVDPNAEGVNKLVDAALKHVESERNAKHVMLKVLRVQQQVVAGIKYTLLIEIAPTTCRKDENNLLECPLDRSKDSFICEVQYWEKPWEQTSRIIKNNCTSSQDYKLEEPINTTKKPVHREEAPDFLSELESQIIPEQQINPYFTNEIPQETPVSYNQEPEVIFHPRFTRNEDGQKSQSDTSEKSSDDSDNRKKRESSKHSDSSDSSESSESSESSKSSKSSKKSEKKKSGKGKNKQRSEKDQGEPVPVFKRSSEKFNSPKNDDPTVKKLIGMARKFLGSDNIQLIGYTKVILDETHYKLDFLVEKDRHFDECSVYLTLNENVLDATVNKVLCGNNRVKRSLPGGLSEESKDNAEIKTFLKDGLLHLDSLSDHPNRYKIKDIISAQSQVVSGKRWVIKANVILSDCEKSKIVDMETCGELGGSPSKTCTFNVWNQPWLPQGRKTNITCDNYQYYFRARRSLLDYDEELLTEIKFINFVEMHEKRYRNKEEYTYRLKIFTDNLKRISLLNKYEQGTASYGITKFADFTPKEFSQFNGLRMDLQNENEIPFPAAEIPEINLPVAFDWRDKNAVTPVKDQGSCGSCWAFSTTGNVEGQYAIKYKTLKEFSEQELVDCDRLDEGCNGGLMDNAYRTIEKLGGLETESDYPYEAEDEKCHFNKSKVVVQLSGALNISTDETDMAKWLTQNGPISIAINANAMQFYAGGVSHPWKSLCNPKSLDHGVLIVGYGVHKTTITKKTLPYWIVKNSWGKTWGEHGYYLVYRGDGTCGLNQTPSSAIVA